jgi:hypothetical protein
MNPYEYRISLRVMHPIADLQELSFKIRDVTDLLLSRIVKAGDPRETPRGEKLDGIYNESLSSLAFRDFLTSPEKSNRRPLPDVLEEILEKLTPIKDDLADFIKDGGTLAFFIGIFIDGNSGEIFSPPLLRQLADFNIELQFDMYSSESSNLS